jgi:hypothetical protein
VLMCLCDHSQMCLAGVWWCYRRAVWKRPHFSIVHICNHKWITITTYLLYNVLVAFCFCVADRLFWNYCLAYRGDNPK